MTARSNTFVGLADFALVADRAFWLVGNIQPSRLRSMLMCIVGHLYTQYTFV